jgi:RNA-binding protein 8A
LEEYCRITNMHLNHDKRTGYVKGYALVEVDTIDDAMEILDAHKSQKIEVLGRELEIDFAFVQPPRADNSGRRKNAHSSKGRHNDEQARDISPSRI